MIKQGDVSQLLCVCQVTEIRAATSSQRTLSSRSQITKACRLQPLCNPSRAAALEAAPGPDTRLQIAAECTGTTLNNCVDCECSFTLPDNMLHTLKQKTAVSGLKTNDKGHEIRVLQICAELHCGSGKDRSY